jgi:hypothetical protein
MGGVAPRAYLPPTKGVRFRKIRSRIGARFVFRLGFTVKLRPSGERAA